MVLSPTTSNRYIQQILHHLSRYRRAFNSDSYHRPRTKPIKSNTVIMKGAYALLAIPVGAFCLGTWQISRRKWKLELLDDLQEKSTREPVLLPEDLADLSSMEYVRVLVRGTFDHSREFLLGPRPNLHAIRNTATPPLQDRIGYMVITPFVLSDRPETILVNRGWVPKRVMAPEKRPDGQIEGEIQLVGKIRLQEKHNFGRAAIADDNVFIWRDIEKMARYAATAPVYIDADKETSVPGGPIGGQTPLVLRNQHSSYVLTWYSLALISAVLWIHKFKRPPLPMTTQFFNEFKSTQR